MIEWSLDATPTQKRILLVLALVFISYQLGVYLLKPQWQSYKVLKEKQQHLQIQQQLSPDIPKDVQESTISAHQHTLKIVQRDTQALLQRDIPKDIPSLRITLEEHLAQYGASFETGRRYSMAQVLRNSDKIVKKNIFSRCDLKVVSFAT